MIGRGRIIADDDIEVFIKGHGSASVRVRTTQDADLATALAHAGAQVETTPDGAMVVSGLDAAGIGGVAASAGITLLELAPQVASLEQAFFELTNDQSDYRAVELTAAIQGA